jgi:hypothetical protein
MRQRFGFKKGVSIAFIFGLFYFGLTISPKKSLEENRSSFSSLVSLGMQVQAYCNEAPVGNFYNDGKCSGTHNEPLSRCYEALSPIRPDCTRVQ